MTQEKKSLKYSDAGVDIEAATVALSSIKELVRRTYTEHVLRDIGTFGAMFQPDLQNYKEPVLVSSVDGVGTKLKLAFMTGKHDTVGIDLVSHCVNDILVQGARPLFFLDYFAMGKLKPEVVVEVVRGLAAGCRYAGCSLIGGETAEMPDMYREDEYDLAGTIVGIVDRSKIIDGGSICAGDVIVGLPSTGLHTNGYSLARKICFEVAGLDPHDEMPGVGRTVVEALMEPHISYAKLMQLVMRVVEVRGMAHITGGGITDNLPRVLPDCLAAEVNLWTPGLCRRSFVSFRRRATWRTWKCCGPSIWARAFFSSYRPTRPSVSRKQSALPGSTAFSWVKSFPVKERCITQEI